MTYAAYDAEGYLGDVASIGGWEEFKLWAATYGGTEAQALIRDGHTRDPKLLAAQLEAAHSSNPDVDSIRRGLVEMARRAMDILIIHDGVGTD